jgi:flagellar protein FlbD
MIEITRLNGHPLIINAELIEFVEQNPDTVITLVTGDKMVVREPACEVMQRVVAYRRNLLHHDGLCSNSRQADPVGESSVEE